MSFQAGFRTTRWSLVRSAAGGNDDIARKALEELCAIYWPAVYTFLRRSGEPPERAADVTQLAFVRILERGDLTAVDAERGRFRAWLQACARHAATDAARTESAAKRGGDATVLSIGDDRIDSAERTYLELASDDAGPEELFDRSWARALIDRAADVLRQEWEQRGRAAWFDELCGELDDSRTAPFADIAARLDATEGAVKVAAHRLRGRFHDLLLREARDTVGNDAEALDEIERLLGAM